VRRLIVRNGPKNVRGKLLPALARSLAKKAKNPQASFPKMMAQEAKAAGCLPCQRKWLQLHEVFLTRR
jgi:hypothetical protein